MIVVNLETESIYPGFSFGDILLLNWYKLKSDSWKNFFRFATITTTSRKHSKRMYAGIETKRKIKRKSHYISTTRMLSTAIPLLIPWQVEKIRVYKQILCKHRNTCTCMWLMFSIYTLCVYIPIPNQGSNLYPTYNQDACCVAHNYTCRANKTTNASSTSDNTSISPLRWPGLSSHSKLKYKMYLI